LVPVVERPTEVAEAVDRLADAIARAVDLDAVVSVAQSAPKMSVDSIRQLTETRPMVPPGGSVRIAVPGGRAFSFAYPDNVARLVEAGAEIVAFDPLVDPALPDGTDGLYAGGGFPEVYAEALSSNRPLLADVRRRIEQGLVAWAECGGLLWLCRSLDGHKLCGAIEADGAMTGRLSLGYRVATARSETPVAAAVPRSEVTNSTIRPSIQEGRRSTWKDVPVPPVPASRPRPFWPPTSTSTWAPTRGRQSVSWPPLSPRSKGGTARPVA
jgi:cobyrinic acid a,c-diamide synthase